MMKINKKNVLLLFSIALIITLSYCKKDEKPAAVNSPEYDTTLYAFDRGVFPAPDFKDNPPTVQGVMLGRMLFYEKMLSKDGSQACANCHLQTHGFSDSATFSIGVEGKQGKRQAMAAFNTAWHNNEFFWDGRAHLLRDQSLKPIQDPLEMNETLERVVTKLSNSPIYTDQFIRAFGTSEVTAERMSLAMEQFMNTIISNRSKYDKFLSGELTLSEEEERGRKLFFKEYNEFLPNESGADCAHCHSGFNFTNDKYINNGLDDDAQQTDIGRQKVSNNPMDKAKFKVPSLRNIGLTAPYMHDGRFKTLEEVVNHYNDGIHLSPSVAPELAATKNTGLRLTAQDKTDLIAFLHTLTDNELAKDVRYSSPF